MKSIRKVLCMSLVLGCLIVPTQAHSGRLDSNGGHHDYKNVSGLGSYHYHDGLDGSGYPAHLHTNGVCPYANVHTWEVGSSSSSSSSVKASTTITQKVTTPTYTVSSYAFKYGTTSFNVKGINKSNTTLVALRDLCAHTGITINSIQGNTIKLSKGSKTLTLGIGNSKAYTNTASITLSVPVMSYNSVTYVPAKDVLSALGCSLSWVNGVYYIK